MIQFKKSLTPVKISLLVGISIIQLVVLLKALKSNRLVALSKEDKLQGRFQRIDSLDWSDSPICGWVRGMDIIFDQ